MRLREPAQLVLGGFFDRADEAAACVVDQDVDAAMPEDQVGYDRGDPAAVGDIELDRSDAVGMRGHERAERLGMSSRGDDGVAGVKRRLGDRAADPEVAPVISQIRGSAFMTPESLTAPRLATTTFDVAINALYDRVVELTQLRYVVGIAREGDLGRAALALQSASPRSPTRCAPLRANSASGSSSATAAA